MKVLPAQVCFCTYFPTYWVFRHPLDSAVLPLGKATSSQLKLGMTSSAETARFLHVLRVFTHRQLCKWGREETRHDSSHSAAGGVFHPITGQGNGRGGVVSVIAFGGGACEGGVYLFGCWIQMFTLDDSTFRWQPWEKVLTPLSLGFWPVVILIV